MRTLFNDGVSVEFEEEVVDEPNLGEKKDAEVFVVEVSVTVVTEQRRYVVRRPLGEKMLKVLRGGTREKDVPSLGQVKKEMCRVADDLERFVVIGG